MKQAIWLNNFIYHMKVVRSIERLVKILCDNASTVFFVKNNKRSEALRLMDIKYSKGVGQSEGRYYRH